MYVALQSVVCRSFVTRARPTAIPRRWSLDGSARPGVARLVLAYLQGTPKHRRNLVFQGPTPSEKETASQTALCGSWFRAFSIPLEVMKVSEAAHRSER